MKKFIDLINKNILGKKNVYPKMSYKILIWQKNKLERIYFRIIMFVPKSV